MQVTKHFKSKREGRPIEQRKNVLPGGIRIYKGKTGKSKNFHHLINNGTAKPHVGTDCSFLISTHLKEMNATTR